MIYLKSVLIIVSLVALDQFSKFGTNGTESASLFFVTISPLKNYNVFLGSMGELPVALRTIVLTSLLGFIFASAYFIQYLLVKPLSLLRVGISMLLAGVTGNIIDKSLFGYVRDFISIASGYSFNFADISLVIGISLIVISIFKDSSSIWYEDSLRKTILIDTKTQISFSMKVVAAVIFYFLTVFAFSASFMTTALIPTALRNSFLIGITCLTGLFIIFVFLFSIIISKRVIGPIYAFERFVDRMGKGDRSSLKLRSGDYFRSLETTGNKILKITSLEKKI